MSDYERNEATHFHRQLQEIEKAPLADRKAGAADYLEAMKKDPSIIGERIGWLLDGNYGYGAMQAAKRIVASPRMNRVAALSIIIAALEYQCPARLAAAAWKKLTKAQRDSLDDAIKTEISELRKLH